MLAEPLNLIKSASIPEYWQSNITNYGHGGLHFQLLKTLPHIEHGEQCNAGVSRGRGRCSSVPFIKVHDFIEVTQMVHVPNN